ncbi:6-phosphogluconate dehydrogenase NAD-binding [Gloeothece citriformis PCC 7424]|uniref:6-phosphogluconate dehydrogenase NAD-binding n=1 Tax=Gloeothece citriformis (strain PCC 7424) TaxID=65393 RepID=B7K9P1_GLOC7|nr:NAD(P)-dependent oxidoreductase [Gloeothece citriformis]ACK70009.1 6-phosphogluconate dehydrogenase NAD-binding [Gloeothece citriformis PCC 7424]
MSQQLAFLGLGVMGAPMTANLVRHGYSVKAWNRTPNRPGVEIAENAGAIIVSSIQEAVETADLVFTCVGDVPDVEEVILGEQGVINYAKPNTLIVDFSTIGSKAAIKIGETLKQHNLRFMDAPISGGDIGAQKGTLTIMVGGNEPDFQECKPYLEAMGKTIRLCGSVGSGQAVKLCNQALVSLYMVGLCEAVEMAKQQGIDPNLMIEVCSTGAAGSWALTNLAPKITASDYNPGFMIKHILKDLRLVKETLNGSSDIIPGVDLADRLFKIVAEMDNGQGENQGTQAMIRAYQN